jgi:hypothetical protein
MTTTMEETRSNSSYKAPALTENAAGLGEVNIYV